MKNLSIFGKMLCALSAFALFVLSATVFTTSKMRTIDNTYSDLRDHQGVATALVARGSRAVWAMRAAIGELLLSTTDEGNKAAADLLKQQRSDLASYMEQAAALLPNDAAKFSELEHKAFRIVDEACAQTIEAGKATDANAVLHSQALFRADCAPALEALSTEYRVFNDALLKETKFINDATTDVTNATITTTWGIILGGLAMVLVGAFFAIRHWVSGPLTRLGATMSAIAGGDYTVVVEGVDRKDEVGSMARVAKVFQATGLEKVALEAETARQRQIAEDKRQQDELAQKQLAEQQTQIVQGLAAGLDHLAEGDLVFRLEQPFAAEYERLRADFNATISKLQETVTVIAGSTSAIRAGTGEISTAADDLSRRTEQQAASLEETAAALDEITATVKKTASGATHANAVVSSAKSDAEASGKVVGRAVEAMGAIERSSTQIGQIIGVIDEIAFQTNLLALNAGVEAARAGEAGRGFAVVASEVRALAQRSAEAAKEIKALISTSAQQVDEGVELVGETGNALDRIAGQVAEINAIVTEIAASAQEQAAGLEQVNTAINQMDQVTQQNAAMVEESTAASRNLSTETDELARLVGQFRTGAATPPRQFVSPRRPSAQFATALKVTGRGGAATNTAPQEASWEEF